MSERITEAELRDIEVKSVRFRDGAGGDIVTLFAGCCEDVVAEVRRLRGLIVDHVPVYELGNDALGAEAKTIREEQGKSLT